MIFLAGDEGLAAVQDGFVIGGQKIKVGNQIELESFKYRVQGVVADLNAE